MSYPAASIRALIAVTGPRKRPSVWTRSWKPRVLTQTPCHWAILTKRFFQNFRRNIRAFTLYRGLFLPFGEMDVDIFLPRTGIHIGDNIYFVYYILDNTLNHVVLQKWIETWFVLSFPVSVTNAFICVVPKIPWSVSSYIISSLLKYTRTWLYGTWLCGTADRFSWYGETSFALHKRWLCGTPSYVGQLGWAVEWPTYPGSTVVVTKPCALKNFILDGCLRSRNIYTVLSPIKFLSLTFCSSECCSCCSLSWAITTEPVSIDRTRSNPET